MAQRLAAIASKAKAAAEPLVSTAVRETSKQYESLMSKNAQYVVKEEPNKLLKQYVFTQLARIPTGITACKEEATVLKGKWGQLRELNASEVGTYLGFTAELYAWFCIGEIIGRGGSLTGYNV